MDIGKQQRVIIVEPADVPAELAELEEQAMVPKSDAANAVIRSSATTPKRTIEIVAQQN